MQRRKAFSYIRMSTEAQLKGNSLARQLALTKEYASQMNLELVEDLRDIGLSAHSGKNITSGQLGQFLKALDEGEIEEGSVLIVESFDRLSRKDPMEAFAQLSSIINKGVEVHTISDRQIYTTEIMKSDVGKLFTSLGVMYRAYSESEEKSRRLKKAWETKRGRLETHILTGKCPAWLKPKEDRSGFDLDPYAADIVRKIFDLCINQNMGAFSIANYFNRNIEKYPKFTQPTLKNRQIVGNNIGWHKSYILKILNSKATYGEFQPGELKNGKPVPTQDVFENYFPAAISKVDFNKAQEILKERGRVGGGRKGEVFSNIFTKLVTCGYCGATVHFLDKGKGPKGGIYLRCSNAASGHRCKCTSWNYNDFEDAFFKYIDKIDFNSVFKTPQTASKRQALLAEKNTLNADLVTVQTKLNRALDIHLSLSESAQKRTTSNIQEISDEMDKIEDRIKQIDYNLSKLTPPNYNSAKKAITTFLKKVDVNNENSPHIRRSINTAISKTIKEIKLFPQASKGDIFPWEYNNLPTRAIKAFKKDGIRKKDLESLLSKASGQNMLHDMERYFIVKFKNELEKTVRPFYDISYDLDYSGYRNFKDRVAKKRETKQLEELKASRKVIKSKRNLQSKV